MARDCMTNLYDSHARDDKLGQVYQTNSENYLAVNTTLGQTERVNMRNNVCLG